MVATFDYEQATLGEIAQNAIKDLGVLTSWSIRVHNGGASLVVLYTVAKSWTYSGAEPLEHRDVLVPL